MNLKRLGLAAIGGAVLASAGAFALAAQEEGMPPMPEPSPEHAHVMARVGTWDCAMKMWMGPGDPMEFTGTEVNRALGPFHVLSEFKCDDMMGMPFEGHGVMSWDPVKKKYVSIWVDATEPTPAIAEGTYDEKTKTLTFTGDAMMMGQKMRMRQVVTLKDADHAAFDMFLTAPGAKEMQSMNIEYSRRK